MSTAQKKKVLHLGSGEANPDKLHQSFKGPGWQEVRMDENPKFKPDIIGDFRQLKKIPDASMDAVWLPHQLQRLYLHEVPAALAQCYRLMKQEAMLLILVPDLQAVGDSLTRGRPLDKLYQMDNGEVAGIDLLYGLRSQVEKGHLQFANHSGFTAYTLGPLIKDAGFVNIQVKREGFGLWGVGFKLPETAEKRTTKITVFDPDQNKYRLPGSASDLPDELNRPPVPVESGSE